MKSKLIFDVGCHVGEDSDFYLRKGFRVVAVEANPTLCDGLRRRFADDIATGNFTLIEKAVAAQAGSVAFYVNLTASIWGSLSAERSAFHGVAGEQIFVQSIRFESLLEEFGVPYYLKIDIEGAEMLCLEALPFFQDRPRFLSIEIDHRSILRKELKLLTRMGYTRFQIVDQSTVPAQREPYPAREGNYSDYRLQLGMSGLFGEELPGSWLSSQAVRSYQLKMIAHNRLRGISKRLGISRLAAGATWYDLHASQ